MSIVDLAFIAMVVVGMSLFVIVLAWACWYTRAPAPAARFIEASRASRPSRVIQAARPA